MEPIAKLKKLFAEIDRTAYGPAERALLDEAIAVAEEHGLDREAYEARLRVVVSAKMTGDTEALLSTFAWCVGRNAADPTMFPAKIGDFDLLWYHKWMAGTLGADPMFETAMIEDCLDQMETAYTRAGVGLSGVHQARFWAAVVDGRLDEAERLHSIVQATPRDDYSHCEACVRSEDAEFLYLKGDYAGGVALVDEMLEEQLYCGEEPERALAAALVPLLRLGREDDAKRFHYRSYRDVRSNPDHLPIVADHLVFLAVTGNARRGLELLERHLPWLVHDGLNVSGHRQALTAFAMIGRTIEKAGHGDELVRHAPGLERYLGERDAPWTVRELTAACWSAAEKLAAAFDARNGNTFRADRLAAARELADERWDVPLGQPAPPTVAVTVPERTTAAEWIDHARSLMVFQEIDGAVEAGVDALHTASRIAETPTDRAAIHLGLLAAHRFREETDEARARHARYVDVLVEQGRLALAEVETTHRDLFHGDPPPESAPILEALTDHDDAEVAVAATIALARLRRGEEAYTASDELYRTALRFARAAEDRDSVIEALHGLIVNSLADDDKSLADVVERAEALLSEDRIPGRRAKLLELLTDARFRMGEQETALEHIDAALTAAAPIGFHALTAHLARIAARVCGEIGRAEESVARWQVALREATLAGEDTFTERIGLAEQLTAMGAAFDAVDLLREMLAEGGDDTSPDQAARDAHTLFLLGAASRRCGEDGDAYGAYRNAIAAAETAEQPIVAARAGERLAAMLLDYNDEESVEVLDEALDAVEGTEAIVLIVDILHLRGRARCRFGDAGGIEDLDSAAARAVDEAPPWVVADIADSKSRGLRDLGRFEEAIRLALSASDGYADAGDEVGAGSAALTAGEILVEQERFDEAAAVLPDAIDRVRPVQQLFARACLAAGTAYERLGRLDEAAAVRSQVE